MTTSLWSTIVFSGWRILPQLRAAVGLSARFAPDIQFSVSWKEPLDQNDVGIAITDCSE
jgi:hypothetical protein